MKNAVTALRRAIRAATPALALGTAALTAALAACSDGPMAPTQASASALRADLSWRDLPFDADGDGRLSDVEKSAKQAADKATKAQMDSLKKDWRAYKDSVTHGTITAEFLRCEPRPSAYAVKRIGPKGGEIKLGDNVLTVPEGALDSEVEISAFAPTSSRAELEFQPHGLRFKTPVEMRVSYKGCLVPGGSDSKLSVLYVENGYHVVERMPTRDKKDDQAVTALTDHFSGYLVGWSRTGSQ